MAASCRSLARPWPRSKRPDAVWPFSEEKGPTNWGADWPDAVWPMPPSGHVWKNFRMFFRFANPNPLPNLSVRSHARFFKSASPYSARLSPRCSDSTILRPISQLPKLLFFWHSHATHHESFRTRPRVYTLELRAWLFKQRSRHCWLWKHIHTLVLASITSNLAFCIA